MLVVISPAKTLDFETPPTTSVASMPGFLEDSAELITELREYSPAKLSELMGLSDKLAVLNSTRYETWQRPFTPENAKQALLAFRGDVYLGLEAESLSEEDYLFAQQHLRILSGLYGVLKPLDLIQPYRLEMGTSLKNDRGANLYQFWGEKITEAVNKELASSGDTLINLASNEYFKVLQTKNIDGQTITPVFKDWKNGKYKVISFFAKKARGMMARFIVKNAILDVEEIKEFSAAGYGFNAELSSDTDWVFTRKE